MATQPTEAEIEAAARALHEMLRDDHTMRGCLHMAQRALIAAARVRATLRQELRANQTGDRE